MCIESTAYAQCMTLNRPLLLWRIKCIAEGRTRHFANFRVASWKLTCRKLTIFLISIRLFYSNNFSQFLYTRRQSWLSKPVFEHDVVANPWPLLRVSQRHWRTNILHSTAFDVNYFSFKLMWNLSFYAEKCLKNGKKTANFL
jgi:hypothetical protein